MKKAVVVGGSNGIGLSIVKELVQLEYFVYILDIVEPDFDGFLNREKIEFIYTDLSQINPNVFTPNFSLSTFILGVLPKNN